MKVAESANGKFIYYTGFCTHCIVIINITGLARAMKIQITVSYKDLNPQTGAPFRFIKAHQCGYRDFKFLPASGKIRTQYLLARNPSS